MQSIATVTPLTRPYKRLGTGLGCFLHVFLEYNRVAEAHFIISSTGCLSAVLVLPDKQPNVQSALRLFSQATISNHCLYVSMLRPYSSFPTKRGKTKQEDWLKSVLGI